VSAHLRTPFMRAPPMGQPQGVAPTIWHCIAPFGRGRPPCLPIHKCPTRAPPMGQPQGVAPTVCREPSPVGADPRVCPSTNTIHAGAADGATTGGCPYGVCVEPSPSGRIPMSALLPAKAGERGRVRKFALRPMGRVRASCCWRHVDVQSAWRAMGYAYCVFARACLSLRRRTWQQWGVRMLERKGMACVEGWGQAAAGGMWMCNPHGVRWGTCIAYLHELA
jgi:hypothetical protein